MKINEAMLKRCETEVMYMTKQDKRLNENYKSYQDYYKAILNMHNDVLKDLREKQQKTKEVYEDNDRQLKLYSQLKDILTVKLQSLKGKK